MVMRHGVKALPFHHPFVTHCGCCIMGEEDENDGAGAGDAHSPPGMNVAPLSGEKPSVPRPSAREPLGCGAVHRLCPGVRLADPVGMGVVVIDRAGVSERLTVGNGVGNAVRV